MLYVVFEIILNVLKMDGGGSGLNLIVCPFILLFEKRYTITFMQIAHSILLQLYYAPNYYWFWKKNHTLWITVSKIGQVILFLDYQDQEILV